ncbi:MAG: hypothetical protein FJ306_03510 [Planctomycetes bacterium]|nr:hypothetical protein [Planctomycetota bacterium]
MATTPPSSRVPTAVVVPVLVAVGLGIAWWVGGGGLGHRSVAQAKGTLAIPPGVSIVRIEVASGTLGVDAASDPAAAPVVEWAGGVRRAADTAEELQQLDQVAVTLAAATDPARPEVLVLRGPSAPAGSKGVLAFEVGVRLPNDLRVEVVVAGSGHVTVANRGGSTMVQTARGDLRFERCAGAVRAKTGSGNVIAFDHEGDLDVLTGAGDMQAFVRKPAAELRLVTGKGTVQCGVPEGCEFDLDGRAEVGRIGVDFGLQATKVGDYGAAVVGRRGAATTKVVLRTASGHLAFRSKRFG